MSRPPSFPEDASVGSPVGRTDETEAATGAEDEGSGRRKRMVTGAAIGIGSAALVAALLYANRGRRPAAPAPAKARPPEPSD